MKNDHRSKFSNLSNWKEEASKKKKNQGFNWIQTRDLRVAGALLYQLSYETTHWERGQFIETLAFTLRKQKTPWLPLSERVYHFLDIYVSVVIDVHQRQPRLSLA